MSGNGGVCIPVRIRTDQKGKPDQSRQTRWHRPAAGKRIDREAQDPLILLRLSVHLLPRTTPHLLSISTNPDAFQLQSATRMIDENGQFIPTDGHSRNQVSAMPSTGIRTEGCHRGQHISHDCNIWEQPDLWPNASVIVPETTDILADG
jgi:hypothetical protein